MKSTWKKHLLYAAYILLASGLLYGLLQLILSGYAVTWTGFQTKTLWDWMDLLIIPLVLALGAIFLNRSERAVEREIAEKRAELERENAKDRQREAALQSYISQMSGLLIDKQLKTTDVKEVRDIAKTLTVSVMRWMDKNRNDLIFQFLLEANLITDENSILNKANLEGIDLQGLYLHGVHLQNANLQKSNLGKARLGSSNLSGAKLIGVNLNGANLMSSILKGASLVSAKLQSAYLYEADLQEAFCFETDFHNANLTKANLEGVDLEDANLEGANLEGANLKDAQITPKQLTQAKSLKRTIMPDGTIHE